MKKILASFLALGAVLAAQAQFTPGDLVVLQVGDGSAALTSAGTAIFLDEYLTSGFQSAPTYNVTISASGANSLVNSGTATSEGALNLSANGQYLVFAGYNVNAGTAGVGGASASSAPRGVGIVNAAGTYTLAATTTTALGGNNVRSGASDGNGNYWAVGGATGLNYLGTTSPANPVTGTVLNSRVVQDIGGNLFYSTGSGLSPGGRGIYEISGTPTSGAVATNILLTTGTQFGAASSPYDFAFNSSMTLAYVADSTAFTTSSGMGGVERWHYNGSSWVFDYSLSLGTNGAVGLAVDFSAENPTIYATSAMGTNLFGIVDTGAGSTATLLASAAANTVFRGLDFAPTPEPATLALGGLGFAALLVLQRKRKA